MICLRELIWDSVVRFCRSNVRKNRTFERTERSKEPNVRKNEQNPKNDFGTTWEGFETEQVKEQALGHP